MPTKSYLNMYTRAKYYKNGTIEILKAKKKKK